MQTVRTAEKAFHSCAAQQMLVSWDNSRQLAEFQGTYSTPERGANLKAVRSNEKRENLVTGERKLGVVCVGHHRLQNLEINVFDANHRLGYFLQACSQTSL